MSPDGRTLQEAFALWREATKVRVLVADKQFPTDVQVFIPRLGGWTLMFTVPAK